MSNVDIDMHSVNDHCECFDKIKALEAERDALIEANKNLSRANGMDALHEQVDALKAENEILKKENDMYWKDIEIRQKENLALKAQLADMKANTVGAAYHENELIKAEKWKFLAMKAKEALERISIGKFRNGPSTWSTEQAKQALAAFGEDGL